MARDDDIVREAKKLFERCVAWESTARHNARIDRRFANGDSYNHYQWDAKVRSDRLDRPSLTHNKVRQHNLQITNDAKQNKAQIKITPTGGQATYEAAQVFAGIIRRIEYQSKAIDAYSTAIHGQVESGIGFVRVETDYVSADSFDLDIYIRRVADPETIYMDPDAKQFDKSDMMFCFVFEDIPRYRWEAEHGPHEIPPPMALDAHSDTWVTKDHVRIAQYWRRNATTDRLHLLDDGTTVKESALNDTQLDQIRPQITQSRDIGDYSVEWFRIEGNEITDRGIWPGKYIPVVPFLGEETVIDGVLDRKGHTRSQIDAQRIYNYWASAAVEQVALQTKVPYITTIQAVEGHEKYWDTANVKNHAYLPYNGKDDDGQPVPPPQRSPPPEMASAYVQGMTLARQDLLDVTGQYQAELGMPGNERSGTAISARQRQGDNATYHYIDNQAKAIRQVGRILIDLIPRVYDTARVTKIMGLDGTDHDVLVAPTEPAAHQQVQMGPNGQPIPVGQDTAAMQQRDENTPDPLIIFNPNVGTYDVEADVGPSYGTQRQEAANAFAQIMIQNPAAFTVIGDFWAQNSDFPGADQLAERLRKGLPQQYQPGNDPQVMMLQQQMQQMHQAAQKMLGQADAQIASLNADKIRLQEQLADKHMEGVNRFRKSGIEEYDAETRRMAAIGAVDPQSMQLLVRQLVRDALGTELPSAMANHALMQQAHDQIQPTGEPGLPEPPEQPQPAQPAEA